MGKREIMEYEGMRTMLISKHGFVRLEPGKLSSKICAKRYFSEEGSARKVNYHRSGIVYDGCSAYLEEGISERDCGWIVHDIVNFFTTFDQPQISYHSDEKELAQLKEEKQDIIQEFKRMEDRMDALRTGNEDLRITVLTREARIRELEEQVVELEADKFVASAEFQVRGHVADSVPESGPSAVSKAKEYDFHRGPRIYCQGDYLD